MEAMLGIRSHPNVQFWGISGPFEGLCRGAGASHGKLAKPSHQMALEKPLRIKAQSCTMLRLSHKAMCDVVADITRSKDVLNLKPGNAAGI